MSKSKKKPCGAVCTQEECRGNCEALNPMTNFERIKNMTVEEMAQLLTEVEEKGHWANALSTTEECKQWLESEVTSDE